MPDRWLRADTVIIGDGTVMADAAVGIGDDGRIVGVVPARDLDPGQRRRSEGLGAVTIAPGFIDAHVHLLFSCDTDHERTRRRFVEATDAALAATGARNAAECLLGGVTTVRDLGDTRWIVRDIRDAVAHGLLPGPRILTAGAPLTTRNGHLNWCGNVADSDAEVRDRVRALLDGGADAVKIMSSGGNMTRESDPLTAQFSAAAIGDAVRLAHAAGRRVAAHSQNAEAIRRCIAAGVDTLEHCLWRDGEGRPAPSADLVAALRAGSSTVVITLAGIARAMLPDATGFTAQEAHDARATSPTGSLAEDFAWARDVRAAGLPVVVASDAGVRFTPFRRFTDTIRAAVVALGLTPAEAVTTVTGLAADAIGLSAEVGRLVPGLRADLTVLDGADVEHRLGEVVAVYRDGARVVDHDRVILPDPPPLR
ncbi:MAG: amidohydrolase family protein [Microbacterium sp.]